MTGYGIRGSATRDLRFNQRPTFVLALTIADVFAGKVSGPFGALLSLPSGLRGRARVLGLDWGQLHFFGGSKHGNPIKLTSEEMNGLERLIDE